jgi:hypothetical protein
MIRSVAIITLVWCVALGQELRAQRAVVPRPDTLGAQFDDQHPVPTTAGAWDFLLGSWRLRYQQRDPATGDYGPVVTGTWSAARTHDGAIVEDEFALIRPGTGRRGSTVTYRVFSPAKQLWSIQGVATGRGVWQPGIAWSDSTARYVVQDNPDTHTRLRIRYYAIEKDHFLWRADGSRDDGKTWIRDILLIEASRAVPTGE